MEIKTKLNIGDNVYIIGCGTFVKHIRCTTCNESGKISLKDWDDQTCPRCYGKGYTEEYGEDNWHVLGHTDDVKKAKSDFYSRPIGKIEAEVVGQRSPKIKIRYTLKGTGNFFYEENCFSSLEEAQAECEKRNQEIANQTDMSNATIYER